MWYVVLAGLPAASKPEFFEFSASDPLTLLWACVMVGVIQLLKWVGESRKGRNNFRVVGDIALSMALLWVFAAGLHVSKALNMATLVIAVFALGVSGKDLVKQFEKFVKEKAPMFWQGFGNLLFQTFFSGGKKEGE